MIKGINRRVIEINRTNNEYFEKIVFYVKGDKRDIPDSYLYMQVNECLKDYNWPEKKNINKKSLLLSITLGISLLLILLGIFLSLI